jgi:CRP/FNR family transcriptional regulator, cyclic AMP receptor protein
MIGHEIQTFPHGKREVSQPGNDGGGHRSSHGASHALGHTKTPYGLQVIESCLNCPMRQERLFCNLSPRAVEALAAISSSATYPKGAILFVEGQEPRGVFVICNGRVKLTASSSEGKSLITRIAEAGEVIGLPGSLSGKPYELTAEALEPIQANFIPRNVFVDFLKEYGEAALRVAEMLSEIYHSTHREIRYLGLSGTASQKLARFLLDFTGSQPVESGAVRATMTLTHEEIAEMIGASRETVTRLFGSFKKKGLIEVHGSTLVLKSRKAMQEALGT